MMRRIHGEAKYARDYQQGIDATFQRIEQSLNQKSTTEIVAEIDAKYRADLERCARGEEIEPGSMAAGPACKAARERGSAQAPTETALDRAGGMRGILSVVPGIPGLAAVGAAFDAAHALVQGDTKQALNLALGAVPGGKLIEEAIQTGQKAIATAERVKKAVDGAREKVADLKQHGVSRADGLEAVREGFAIAQTMLAKK
jgi:hypothetical protein